MKTKTILLGTMLLSLFYAIAVPARAQTANNNFRQAVTANHTDATAEKVILMAAAVGQMPPIPPPPPPPPTPIPEEARRHFVRGTALFKDAKSPDDYKLVVDEFTQAANLAPWWPEARYNLALAQEAEGDYDKAIENLKLYLQFKLPDADARAAQDKMYTLEARQEKAKDKVNAGYDLGKAINSNNVAAVRAAIARGAEVNTHWGTCVTPLTAAANTLNSVEVVRVLLDNGADVNATVDCGIRSDGCTQNGKTALMFAVEWPKPDVVRLLIDRHANVNARGGCGTALTYAMNYRPIGWAEAQKQQAARDKEEVIRILQDAGAQQ